MPKPYTNPTLFDEVLQLSTTKLKELGYLNPEQIRSGILTWSVNGNEIGSISIQVNTSINQFYIELDYKYRDKPINYRVKLVSMSSNLGEGLIWYFLCPQTNKRCRKLYSIGGYFLHREAFNGCMYESQTQSKYYRQLAQYFIADRLYSQLYSKHFKRTYAGKPTKKYLSIMNQIAKSESGMKY